MSDRAVMVDGMWVASRADVSDVAWSTRFGEGPCGPYEASCVVAADPRDSSDWLRLGRVFEVYQSGRKVFGGRIAEMPSGFPRRIMARGWASCEDRPVRVAGERWGRTAENVTYTPAADTTHSWLLDASGLEIGVADDALYTRVVATFVEAITVDPDTGADVENLGTVTVDDTAAQTLYGTVTYLMDLTGLGVISSGTATTKAQAQLAEFTVPEWLERVQVDSFSLLSPGGVPADLSAVTAGQVVRLFNVPRLLAGIQRELAFDVVIGEVEHGPDQNTITIAPVRRAVRDLAALAEQAARLAATGGPA